MDRPRRVLLAVPGSTFIGVRRAGRCSRSGVDAWSPRRSARGKPNGATRGVQRHDTRETRARRALKGSGVATSSTPPPRRGAGGGNDPVGGWGRGELRELWEISWKITVLFFLFDCKYKFFDPRYEKSGKRDGRRAGKICENCWKKIGNVTD